MVRYGNRITFGLSLLTLLFLGAKLLAILLYSLTPAKEAARGPLLVTAFVAILLGSQLVREAAGLILQFLSLRKNADACPNH
jgi:hypothetical protein